MERNIARGTMDPGKKYLKHALESILSGIRYGVKKKNTGLFGNFSQMAED